MKKKIRPERGWVPLNQYGDVVWSRARGTRAQVIMAMGGHKCWEEDRSHGWRIVRCCIERRKDPNR